MTLGEADFVPKRCQEGPFRYQHHAAVHTPIDGSRTSDTESTVTDEAV